MRGTKRKVGALAVGLVLSAMAQAASTNTAPIKLPDSVVAECKVEAQPMLDKIKPEFDDKKKAVYQRLYQSRLNGCLEFATAKAEHAATEKRLAAVEALDKKIKKLQQDLPRVRKEIVDGYGTGKTSPYAIAKLKEAKVVIAEGRQVLKDRPQGLKAIDEIEGAVNGVIGKLPPSIQAQINAVAPAK